MISITVQKRLLYILMVIVAGYVPYYSQAPVADLINRVRPSVVKIVVYDDSGSATKTGSGFFISKSKLVTNKHVISGSKSIGIQMFDETILYAHRIQNIPDTDVAILEFDSKGKFIKPLPIAATLPRVGERVVVFGSPLGLEGSVSDGMISAIRNLRGSNFIQMTAPISSGSSGSPVLDMAGNVIGVATLYIEGGQNLNFAIPVTAFSSYILKDITQPVPIKPENTPAIITSSRRNLTGNWLNLVNGHTYQVVDDGKQLAVKWWLDPLVCRWSGDIAIGYVPGSFFVAMKPLGANRIGVWLSAKLRPTDSEERVLKILTKNTRAKPQYVLELK